MQAHRRAGACPRSWLDLIGIAEFQQYASIREARYNLIRERQVYCLHHTFDA
jgi:hypothetical protein